MIDDTKTLERVGAKVAEALGEGVLSEERRAQQRRAFLAAALSAMDSAQSSRGRNRFAAGLAAVAAVALLAVGASVLVRGGARPLSFWVGDQRVAGSEGTWIESSRADAVPIVFDNGSRVDLSTSTAVRVVVANTERVAVDVSDGEVFADIKRNEGTKWEVNAGPYQVSVLGTAFTVDWEAKSSALVVAVTRGVVHVRGGHLNDYGIRIPAGKRLVVGGGDGKVALEAIGDEEEKVRELADEDELFDGPAPIEPASIPAEPGDAADAKDTPSGGAGVARSGSARGGSHAARPLEDWMTFYSKRDYAAAVAAAEAAGIESLLGRLDMEDLWRLANASRFAHRGDVARRALLSVRARFADTPRASTAAFLLGRSELEDRGKPEIARGWFETYLREARNGPLAEEALGRLMEACDKAGSAADARRYAERYLARYEDGLFAALAKSIIAR